MNMDSAIFFRLLLEDGGQAKGRFPLVDTPMKDAIAIADEAFGGNGNGSKIHSAIPNFDRNYRMAQAKAAGAFAMRAAMPVLSGDAPQEGPLRRSQVWRFQEALKAGTIDRRAPWAPNKAHPTGWSPGNPFPQGLSGDEARKWRLAGLRDGDNMDDRVSTSNQQIPVGRLQPTQKEIYYGVCISKLGAAGVDATKTWIESGTSGTMAVTSSDGHIIDGHHRWVSGMLIDPEQVKMNCMVINLPVKELLGIALAYGDSIGNERNK
jgi:hypothetical protein